MNFCGECGAALGQEPQMVVPLDTIESLNPNRSDDPTESFGISQETVVEDRYQPLSIPTLSSVQPPQSKKKIVAVFGILFAIIVMIIGGAGGGLYYYLKWRKEVAGPGKTPTPMRTAPPRETATPRPTATPTPDSTPEETPEPTPEETPDENDPPSSLEPTKQGSFSINADEEGWQLSELVTVSRESFETSVGGTIDLDGIREGVSARGFAGNPDRRVYKQYPTGALLMRTRYPDGRVSNIQPVTASDSWLNSPGEEGRIEFLINDNEPEDNYGEFTVTLKLVKVTK